MKRILLIATMAFMTFTASLTPAFAEDDEAMDPAVLAYIKARNQLGLLQYCKEKGFTGDAEIGAQQKLLAYIPMPAAVKGDVNAQKDIQGVEDQGKTGLLVDNELDLYKLADVAKARNETEENLCKVIGKGTIEGAAKLPEKK